MYSLIIHFGITKYELSLTSYVGLLHMYHLSVLPPKQHTIPLIASSQISIPIVSPNLTDAHLLKNGQACGMIIQPLVDDLKRFVTKVLQQRPETIRGSRPYVQTLRSFLRSLSVYFFQLSHSMILPMFCIGLYNCEAGRPNQCHVGI